MSVDFNFMLSSYTCQTNLARCCETQAGLAACPWSFEEVGHHAESFIKKDFTKKTGL
jgi:hypothetical protein